eukprot:SAG31_NODE_3217_length_4537_cov_1.607481_2_plen_180_part_00
MGKRKKKKKKNRTGALFVSVTCEAAVVGACGSCSEFYGVYDSENRLAYSIEVPGAMVGPSCCNDKATMQIRSAVVIRAAHGMARHSLKLRREHCLFNVISAAGRGANPMHRGPFQQTQSALTELSRTISSSETGPALDGAIAFIWPGFNWCVLVDCTAVLNGSDRCPMQPRGLFHRKLC